jgi:DNA polymerase I-like protein with 3'-5' exonuclease and polymerase domains
VFDVPTLAHHFGFPQRSWHLTHDTLFLSFLNNPHARSLSLKDLADEHCGMAPTEQRDLQDWILENTPCKSRNKAGAYIADAPADLVAPYAIGDVERTWALWESLRDRVLPSMQQAYDRERRLAPILVGVQNTGLRVDMKKLAVATAQYEETLEQADQTVRTLLNAPGLSLDSDADLVLALQANGTTGFGKTATGKTSAAIYTFDLMRLFGEAQHMLVVTTKKRGSKPCGSNNKSFGNRVGRLK